jgi:hypothetical protein
VFPVGARDYATTKATVELVYGPGLARRLRGARALAATLFGGRG